MDNLVSQDIGLINFRLFKVKESGYGFDEVSWLVVEIEVLENRKYNIPLFLIGLHHNIYVMTESYQLIINYYMKKYILDH